MIAPAVAYGIRAFFSVVGIIFHIIAYSYLDKLEKIQCKCAEDKNVKFMRFALLFLIFYLLINMFIPMPVLSSQNKGGMVYLAVNLGVGLLALIYYIVSIRYVNKLASAKCRCSEDQRREIMFVWGILVLSFISIMFLGMLIAGVSLANASMLATMMAINPAKTAFSKVESAEKAEYGPSTRVLSRSRASSRASSPRRSRSRSRSSRR